MTSKDYIASVSARLAPVTINEAERLYKRWLEVANPGLPGTVTLRTPLTTRLDVLLGLAAQQINRLAEGAPGNDTKGLTKDGALTMLNLATPKDRGSHKPRKRAGGPKPRDGGRAGR